jgi:hypothetical protein
MVLITSIPSLGRKPELRMHDNSLQASSVTGKHDSIEKGAISEKPD